jgi:hypothetical protein
MPYEGKDAMILYSNSKPYNQIHKHVSIYSEVGFTPLRELSVSKSTYEL